MKSFSFVEQVSSLVFLILYLPLLTLSLIPGISCIYWAIDSSESFSLLLRVTIISFAVSSTYFLHQFTLPLLCGMMFRVLPIRYPTGKYRLHSWNGVKWAACTTLHRVARQHFPMYSLPSWYVNLYYRIMGAKIAKGVHVATLLINDPQHVTIGRGAVIGGGAIVNSHSVEGENLIVAENIIGNHATIGLNSILLAGACVGDSAIVGARSVVAKHKAIPAEEKWVGTPAKKIG
jgi:serine acetyltransferase